MKLIDLNINEILLLGDYEFQDSFNNIDYLNRTAISENDLGRKLELLSLATILVEKFHSFFHFEQSYFHLKLAILSANIGDKKQEKEQLDLAIFQDRLNFQAISMISGATYIEEYKRPYNDFVDYLLFASNEKVVKSKIQGYWYKSQDNIESVKDVIEEIRDRHLRYHQESAKLYLNRSLIFHLLNKYDLAKNDLVKAHNLDNMLDKRESYSMIISQMSVKVVLGLGSNLGDRNSYLNQAINKLQELDIIKIVTCSSIIESKADLLENSPKEWDIDFLNMAVKGYTMLDANQLLKKIKDIEQSICNRHTSFLWAPREIDIDILAYGHELIEEEELKIPHIRLVERNWAMEPFIEIWSDWVHPSINKTIKEIYYEKNKISWNS
jgi:2-amino-4-hydroxy-6-hydroxymethyldihydropteridine diphosphokinase